ncbi:MAG: acylneuraminate cytidylyltransferase family protein [Chloroflexi bacterium]|nr:acylneuraminate cytidylyltransferase family protein [Chloroflexota bacterium]
MTRIRSEASVEPSPLPRGATCVGLIPARAGSKRVPGKNGRILGGHPLIAYAVTSALDSGVLDGVIASTDSPEIAELAQVVGAEVPFLRPAEMAGDRSPDIEWIRHLLATLEGQGRAWDCYAILRPTSPFRRPETIRRAWAAFRADGRADSLRAVQPSREHPAKQWIVEGSRMRPVMSNPDPAVTAWHSMPYQALPPVYVQNASLEIARTAAPLRMGSISGTVIMPFLTEGLEGFDINGPDDWLLAEHHAREHPELLSAVRGRS